MPSLVYNGLIKDGLKLRISQSKDIESLWNKTVQAFPYYDIDPQWIKDTFGIEVTKRIDNSQLRMDNNNGKLNLDSFFA